MKKIVYRLSILMLITLVFQSCEDQQEVDVPNFDITFDQTAKVGEPVVFNISNAPQFLNFFSGESGHEYKNSERLKTEGEYFLEFETSRHYFDGASKSDNAWNLLVSTDYTGSGTIEDVQAATWTDITDQFTFATARTHDATASGMVNVSDFASDSPVYFAIRVYAEGKKEEGNRQGVFRVYSFDMTLAVADEDYSLDVTSLTNPGFKPVNVEGTHPSHLTKDTWDNRGSFFELNADQAEYTNDDWLITNAVDMSGAVSPDRGEPLKTYADKLKTFEHVYSAPGTYNIAFVGSNETIYGKEGNVKEYTITVTE